MTKNVEKSSVNLHNDKNVKYDRQLRLKMISLLCFFFIFIFFIHKLKNKFVYQGFGEIMAKLTWKKRGFA